MTTKIKANEDQDFCFSGVSEKSRFNLTGSIKSLFNIFMNLLGEVGQGSIHCFVYKFLILLGR